MKGISSTVLAGVAMGLIAAASHAAGVEDVMKAKACFACHAVDKKLVGPAYKEVAAKYKGDKAAVSKLATKIQKGGAGVWGQVPMPANAVTEAEAKQMAEWVLARK
ncbi:MULTISPECIES: c-type cytochrome [Chitinibacter]|uniref:c-type cytochrome n=1 Tax=Chitinibacter TaxID=230666 RepID=UPI000418DB0C|nr:MULTISPECIES: c-type cytochrome [Chitinibacter]